MAYRPDERYTAQEDRLMQEDLQHTDSIPSYRGDESSYYRTTGMYRPMDGMQQGTSGTYGQSGFYRPPSFDAQPMAEPQKTGYADLQEESYSRIFSSSDSTEDRWGMYDFSPMTEKKEEAQELSYFTDYFAAPKPQAPVQSAPPVQERVHAGKTDAWDDSFLQTYDADVRYDAQEEVAEPPKAERERRHKAEKAPRRKKSVTLSKKAKIAIIAVVLALAAIGLGIFLVDRLVTPMMDFDVEDVLQQEGEIAPDAIPSASAEPETTPQQTPQPSEEPIVEDTVQQAFTIPAWSVYLVQAGAFSDPNNADNYAQSMRASGGAGYIIHSDYHRVMTTAFNNEYDAGQLRDTLMAQTASAQVYELSFSQMDFTVSAGAQDVEVITTALTQWPDLIKSLMTVIRRMEAGEITPQEALVSIKEIHTQLSTSRDALAGVAGAKGSVLVRDLSNMYTEAARILGDVLDGGTLEKGETLARVKYAHIGMCWNYRALVEGIAEDTEPAPETTEAAEESAQ